MTVRDIVNITGCTVLAAKDKLDKEVMDGYVCDLLSWVMAHAKPGMFWITVQTHINVIAVATLMDLACVIIPENIEVSQDTLRKAEEEGIPVLLSEKTAFELCGMLHQFGFEGARK